MFPLTSNEAYIKSTGERSTLGRMLEEGGNEPIEAKLNNEIAARAELGAHNRIPCNLAEIKAANTTGTWADNAYSRLGITFTVNADGSLSVSGTATGAAQFIYVNSNNVIPYGKYIFSGFPSGLPASNDTFLRISKNNHSQVAASLGTDTEVEVTFDESNISSKVYISIANGTEISTPVVFKPMLRIATDADPTYQPYAMTNQELTSAFTNLIPTTNATYTDLSDVPVSIGYATFAAAISPTGADFSGEYICFGDNQSGGTRAIMIYRYSTGDLYINHFSTTWQGWKKVTLTA